MAKSVTVVNNSTCYRYRKWLSAVGMRVLVIAFFALFAANATAQRHEDTDKLGRALEYFQSAKYHEALLLFDYLDRNYTLNPRFRAYMALCYYYEWDYQKAVDYFAKSLPELEGLAPHERSVYYFAAAESCFNLGKYEESTIYYNKVLQVCYPQEQADVYYKLGFCHLTIGQWAEAKHDFESSLQIYRSLGVAEDKQARLPQLERMIAGCEAELRKKELMEKEQQKETATEAETPKVSQE